MRRSGWGAAGAALLLWLAAVLWPVFAAVGACALPAAEVGGRPFADLLLTTIGWSATVALLSIVLGWLPGRVLGAALHRRGFVPLAVLFVAAICLPAYLVFYAWWQSWPADSALHRWAVERGRLDLLRHATLLLGLACWSWPIVAWCVAAFSDRPAQRDELLHLDGVGPLRRAVDRLRTDARGLALGALLVFLATFGNTTSFDLAQIFTFGNELRAMEALGATPGDLLAYASPVVLAMIIAAAGAWLILAGRPREAPQRTTRPARASIALTLLIWLAATALPLALLIRGLAMLPPGATPAREFWLLYGEGAVNTLLTAFASAACAGVIAVGLALAWQDHRPWVRFAAHVQALGWFVIAAMPATLIGTALEAAYNAPAPPVPALGPLASAAEAVYRSPVIVVLGHLARFGFVAALVGRWLAMREPRDTLDLRRLDGALNLPGIIRAAGPRLFAAVVITGAMVAVLSVGEIPVTAFVRPPGFDALAASLLNDMHYQRPQTVMIAAIGLLLGALLAGGIAMVAWRLATRSPATARRVTTIILTLLIALVLTACDEPPDGTRPFNALRTFGSPGAAPAQFNYPRGIAADPVNNAIYIVDKLARVQRFRPDGEHVLEWRMPAMDNGKPTGLNVAPDGTVYVADTHYWRIIQYTPEGEEVRRFGSFGEAPGQFIYPTDVEFGADGRIYVSEYGGNDRIQVFSPEAEFLFTFGSFGPQRGQFNRPQSMHFNRDKTELFIADACNHRIVVVDPEGRVLRTFGRPGRAAGQLSYPYDVTVLPDGTLLVAEFGNNRIQHFTAAGETLGLYGRLGFGRGELQYPWGVDILGDEVFILDSGNNRVQVMPLP